MLSLLLWWLGLALELIILGRGLRARMLGKYPYFYAYILCVFVVSAGLYAVYHMSPGIYAHWYWPTQYATLVAGCGVIVEILEQSLKSYAGAMRLLRALFLGIFAAVFCYAGIKVMRGAVWSTPLMSGDMERDLRVVEAILLVTILAAVFYYGIGLGKNVKGMMVGFGAYVGVSLATLAILSVAGSRFLKSWELLQSGSYLFALLVWSVTLWSYAPNPQPERIDRIQPDYAELASQTRSELKAIRGQFKDTARP